MRTKHLPDLLVQMLRSFTEVHILDRVVGQRWVLTGRCVLGFLLLGYGGQHGPLEWFGEPEDAVLTNYGLVRHEVADLDQKWFIAFDERNATGDRHRLVPA